MLGFSTEDFSLQRDGRTVRGRLVAPCDVARGTVLFSSPLARTMDELFFPTYFFLSNGLAVLQYDPTNHPGRSDGDIADYTITEHCRDLCAVLDRWSHLRPVLFAISMGALPTFRALATHDVTGAVLLVPVVAPFRTLERVTGTDWKARHETGQAVPESIDITGFTIRGAFVADGLGNGFGEEEILANAAAISCPVRIIASDADEWVDLEDIRAVATRLVNARLTVVSQATHEFQRNPFVGARYFSAAVHEVRDVLGLSGETHRPPFAEIVAARELAFGSGAR